MFPRSVLRAPAIVTLHLTVEIYGESYTLVVTPESFKLSPQGKPNARRQRVELPWRAFVDDDMPKLSALHAAMKRSRRTK